MEVDQLKDTIRLMEKDPSDDERDISVSQSLPNNFNISMAEKKIDNTVNVNVTSNLSDSQIIDKDLAEKLKADNTDKTKL